VKPGLCRYRFSHGGQGGGALQTWSAARNTTSIRASTATGLQCQGHISSSSSRNESSRLGYQQQQQQCQWMDSRAGLVTPAAAAAMGGQQCAGDTVQVRTGNNGEKGAAQLCMRSDSTALSAQPGMRPASSRQRQRQPHPARSCKPVRIWQGWSVLHLTTSGAAESHVAVCPARLTSPVLVLPVCACAEQLCRC
jgi:hypothetical protein